MTQTVKDTGQHHMTDDQKEHVIHVNALSDGGLFNKPRLPNKKLSDKAASQRRIT